jgi:hypothetical protein
MTTERHPQIFSAGETEMIRIPKTIKDEVMAMVNRERARKLDAMARKFEEAASR